MDKENLKTNEIESLFLRKKPARLLVFIKKVRKPYESILAKKIDSTYSHTVKLLQKMESLGLVQFKKEGRVKYVELTDRGAELAEIFEPVLKF